MSARRDGMGLGVMRPAEAAATGFEPLSAAAAARRAAATPLSVAALPGAASGNASGCGGAACGER